METELALCFDQKLVQSISGFLFRLVGNKEEAEDLTQETLYKAWANLHRFDRTKNFKTWLFSIARNSATDLLRRKKSLPFSWLDRFVGEDIISFDATVESADPTPLEVTEGKERRATVIHAFEELSDDEQVLITLHHADELTFEEIGYVCGRPMNTVKSQYRRSLQKLRTFLSEDPAWSYLAA